MVIGGGHSHGISEASNERVLWWAPGLTAASLLVEVVGEIAIGSLALISDAADMFTDTASLAVVLGAIRIGRRPAESVRTFGCYRFESLAAAFNATLLFLVAIYILFEVYQRLK